MRNTARGNGAGRVSRLLGHPVLLSVLLFGCATASPPPSTPTVSREPASTADLLADTLGKIQQQYIENVSVGRLTTQALRGLEALAPSGAIRVVEVGNGATITHGDSGMPDSSVSISWPASPTASDAGRALDEAGRFAMRQLNAKPTEVLDALCRGLIGVDPEGAYLTQVAQADLAGAGAAGSMGLDVALRDGELVIVAPLAGGRGDRAGLRPGDRMRAVDGTSTAGMKLGDAVRLLHGPADSRASVRITRADWDGPRDVAVLREVVRAPSVEYQMLGAEV